MPDQSHIPSRTPLRLAGKWAATSSPDDRPGVIEEIRSYPPEVRPRLIALVDIELRLIKMPGARAAFQTACERDFGMVISSYDAI